MMKRIAILVAVLGITLAAAAAEPEIVARALDAADKDARKDWAYTMIVVEDGKERIERFDPSRDVEHEWTLVKVESRKPTAGDIEDYRKTKERRRESDDESSLRDMIQEGTLHLLREDDRQAVYAFKVKGKDNKEQKMMDHVGAELHIDKTGPWVERLEMKSAGEFNPMMGVTIEHFAMTITYIPIENGSVVPGRVETKVQGKAFFIKTIDSDVRITFSDYRYVGD